MIKEAIILAGGLGTRLRETISDVPKSMADVAGQPFLTYLIRHLLSQGIEKFIFALGYKHEIIEDFLKQKYSYLNYKTVIEDSPLGTGGSIYAALNYANDRDVLIVNGDTLYKVDLDDLYDQHIANQADCTIALKPMHNFERYGAVEIDRKGVVERFKEKEFTAEGLINGGVYVINKIHFLKNKFPEVFSFEKEYLEAYLHFNLLLGVVQEAYFIDIGVPDDYVRAQHELKYPELDLKQVNTSWTLFLDRDGVINRNKDESYVFNIGEFTFLPGAIEAIQKLNTHFGKVIIITNQRGIGKGLMNETDLQKIHQHMIEEIEKGGGKIDALYFCAEPDDKHHDRKPNPGMLLEASHMYPEIDFTRSIMVGDKMSDMQLGRNVNAHTVLITSRTGEIESHPDIDLRFASLLEFAEALS